MSTHVEPATVEELEDLPERSVVIDKDGDAWQKRRDGAFYLAGDGEDPLDAYDLCTTYSPVTAVYRPKVAS